MTEKCVVKKVKRNIAYIEIARTDKCNACGLCAFNKKKSITVPAKKQTEVSVGDTVSVEMPTRSVGIAALSVYAIPLALMIVGASIGLAVGIWLQATLAAVGIAVGLVIARFIDIRCRRKDGVIPTITAVISADDGVTESAVGSAENAQTDK